MSDSQPLTQIQIIFESGCFEVSSIQFSNRSVSALIIDKYFYIEERELPLPYHNNIIGFLYPDYSSSNPVTSHFFYTLSSFKTIYRAFEETPTSAIYLLFDETNPISTFLIVSFTFQELLNMDVYLPSLLLGKPEQLKNRIEFSEWTASYERSVSDLMRYSQEQNSKISELKQELERKQDQDANLRQLQKNCIFGECLFCCDRAKSIVFLPCGHIVGCYHCVVKGMKIELNKKITRKRTPKLCPLCNGVIIKAKVVTN